MMKAKEVNKIISLAFLICICQLIFTYNVAFAKKPISVKPLSGMNFPKAVAGDSEYIINPGTTETFENASFVVKGEPGKVYSIGLPFYGNMTTLVRGKLDTILLHTFTSYPEWEGVIGKNGQAYFFVGCTRSPIKINQLAGVYRGVFPVTVIY